MRAIFKSYWVRKLIGKLGVPYNRRLRVRGSPHPNDYDAGLSLAAAESNAFRNQSGLPEREVEMISASHPWLPFCVMGIFVIFAIAGFISRRK
jgi:hypothetical protein